MGRKVDVIKAFKLLPYEAQMQIEDITRADIGCKLIEVPIQIMVDDVIWTIDRIGMDISDGIVTAEEGNKDIKQMRSWLKKYRHYKFKPFTKAELDILGDWWGGGFYEG